MRGGFRARSNQRRNTGSETREKKCYICNKPNCWSTKHTPSERKQAYERFKQRSRYPSKAHYQAFLADIEGVETVDTGDDTDTGSNTEIDQLITDWEDNKGITDLDVYTTEMGEINGPETVEILANQAVFYAVTKADIFSKPAQTEPHLAFVLDRYSSESF
jgi:hypothetical protein